MAKTANTIGNLAEIAQAGVGVYRGEPRTADLIESGEYGSALLTAGLTAFSAYGGMQAAKSLRNDYDLSKLTSDSQALTFKRDSQTLAPTGAGTARVSQVAKAKYKEIRKRSTSQVSAELNAIVKNTKVGDLENVGSDSYRKVLSSVREHLFINFHDLPVAPHRFQKQRFRPYEDIADLWNGAIKGTLNDAKIVEFQRLIAHEFVELSLMKTGKWRYSSVHSDDMKLDPEDGQWYYPEFPKNNPGAHDLAPSPHPRNVPYKHWEKLFGIKVKNE